MSLPQAFIERIIYMKLSILTPVRANLLFPFQCETPCRSIPGKVLSYIQGTDSKSSGNAFLNVVQKRDFQGSTGEDHFVIKNEIFEISQEDGVFEIEIEQDNHSYFEEINPRYKYNKVETIWLL